MPDSPAAYRKIGDTVMLRGTVSGGTAAKIFTLPEGFRPQEELTFPASTTGDGLPGLITIRPDGDVCADPVGGPISLDHIKFRV